MRYDERGIGLSDREATDFSLEARLLDLEAVLDHLNVDKFHLLGAADAGPVAITYAARHPQRVSRLVVWCSLAKRSDIASPRIQAWRGLIEQDWELMTDTCAHLALGWSEGDVGRRAAEHLRESVTRDVARAAMAAADTVDVTDLLQQVEMPTLVLHRREISWFPVDVATGLASRMPNAELTLLDGESTAPYLGDAQAAAKAIERFLDAEVDPLRVNGRSVTPRESSLEAEAELDKPRGAVQHGLTEREVQVLRLVAGGQTGKQIAAELVLSPRTVERHVENIYGKIGARNKADATAYALTRGIV